MKNHKTETKGYIYIAKLTNGDIIIGQSYNAPEKRVQEQSRHCSNEEYPSGYIYESLIIKPHRDRHHSESYLKRQFEKYRTAASKETFRPFFGQTTESLYNEIKEHEIYLRKFASIEFSAKDLLIKCGFRHCGNSSASLVGCYDFIKKAINPRKYDIKFTYDSFKTFMMPYSSFNSRNTITNEIANKNFNNLLISAEAYFNELNKYPILNRKIGKRLEKYEIRNDYLNKLP